MFGVWGGVCLVLVGVGVAGRRLWLVEAEEAGRGEVAGKVGGEEEDGLGGRLLFFFKNLNNVGPTHSEKFCHISMSRQQKNLISPPRQHLTANVGQH